MKLIEKIEKKVKCELKEWIEHPTRIDFHFHNNINDLESFINETGSIGVRSIGQRFERLNTWYSQLFVYKSIFRDDVTDAITMAANGYYTLYTEYFAAKGTTATHPKNPLDMPFDQAVYYLANCLIQGWYDEGRTMLEIINEGICGTFLGGGLDFRKTAWFITELTNLAYGVDVECDTFENYPEDMEWYDSILYQWNTQDLELVVKLVDEMCDNHLSEAKFENDNTFYEFNHGYDFLYVYEILTWLSLREYEGLENPSEFSHPLMKYAMNKLPKQKYTMPQSYLFTGIINRFKAELGEQSIP